MKHQLSVSRVQSRFPIMLMLLLSATFCMAQTKPWPVPKEASALKNPFAGDANSVKQGKTLYTTYCSPCHGNSGKGDGPAAAALSPKPANHTSTAIQDEPEGSLFYKISEGRKPMPTYKTTLTDAQRWALVNYIKTLGKNPK